MILTTLKLPFAFDSRQLKADPNLAGIPVILMTVLGDRDLGFLLGAAEYLTKPLDWEPNRTRPPPSCLSSTMIWCRRARISASLSRSLIGNSRTRARALVTPR